MSSHDPHPTRGRDHGLRRMQAVRRWAVALTTAAALALSGLAWSTTASNNASQATSTTSTDTSGSTASDTGSSSSSTDTGASSSAPSSTTRTPAVTSGGS